jgi:hypothetical protein
MRQLQLGISYTELADNVLGKQNYLHIRSEFGAAEELCTALPPFPVLFSSSLESEDIRHIQKPG